MSAISTSNPTGPIPAAHRTDAPVWAFHHLIAVLVWVFQVVGYRLDVWEHRVLTTHPRTAVTAPIGVALGILALVVAAL